MTPPPNAPNGQSIILHKVYECYARLYAAVKAMPKKDRYTLGARMENLLLEIFELAFLAREKSGAGRLLILQRTDVKLKLLRVFVRLSASCEAVPTGTYANLESLLLEIGKLLGGWLKTEKGRPRP